RRGIRPSQLAMQPGAGEGPVAFGGAQRQAERGRNFRQRQTSEVAQFYDLSGQGIRLLEAIQGVAQVDQVVPRFVTNPDHLFQVHATLPTPMPDSPLAPGVLDENAAHGLGRRSEEMAAPVPALPLVDAEQTQVGFMNEGRRLERLARLFLR